MGRFALLTLFVAGACVLTRPEPDVGKLIVRSLPNELDVDVPNLGHWGKVSATLERQPGSGEPTTHPLGAQPAAGSSVLRFADVPAGDYELTVHYGGGDGTRERTVTGPVTHEPPLAFGTISRSAEESCEPRRPVLLAVPAWLGVHEHAHEELARAGRQALEAIVGPAQIVRDETELSRFENDGVLIDKARASLPTPAGEQAEDSTPRAQVVFLLDLRLPNSSGLPCQLALSAFAVGPPIGGLWNRRNLLHQEFVPLAAYELSETRNQSAMLIRAALAALRTSVRAPLLRRALGRDCPHDPAEPRSGHDDLLFPPLLDPAPASNGDGAQSDSKRPEDASRTERTTTTEEATSPTEPARRGQTSGAQATSGELGRGRP